MRHEESDIQKAVIAWFNVQYPDLEGLLVGYVAGLNLSINVRTRMKAMGLRAGFPDLMLLVPKKTTPGLFIELKTEKGKVSPIQKAYHDKLRSQDYTVIISRSFESATESIKNYLKSP